MVVLDGNFAPGCRPGTDFPSIHIFQCMLKRTDAITNEALESITFVLAYPTIFIYLFPLTEALKIWQYQTSWLMDMVHRKYH